MPSTLPATTGGVRDKLIVLSERKQDLQESCRGYLSLGGTPG